MKSSLLMLLLINKFKTLIDFSNTRALFEQQNNLITGLDFRLDVSAPSFATMKYWVAEFKRSPSPKNLVSYMSLIV